MAEYGRVGASTQRKRYPMSTWLQKLQEKINKGYVDQTALHSVPAVPAKNAYAPIEDTDIRELVHRLQSMAEKVVKENYTVRSDTVTQLMIRRAQQILNSLPSAASVRTFNEELQQLFAVIPRRMHKVSDYLASTQDDCEKIIVREQELLDTMRGQVVDCALQDEAAQGDGAKQTILEAKGLKIWHPKESDMERIYRHMGAQNKKLISRAWCVENVKTQKGLDGYMEKNTVDGKAPQVKLFWYGSRNGYWWSIFHDGLQLRPTGVSINGKMFGYGLYFAPKAEKSLGYTSLRGSYWAGGTESTAYMALYAVAYGKPFNVYSDDMRFRSFDYQQLRSSCKGANCLHAHAGSILRNDEIVIYNENQVTMKYLVELKAA